MKNQKEKITIFSEIIRALKILLKILVICVLLMIAISLVVYWLDFTFIQEKIVSGFCILFCILLLIPKIYKKIPLSKAHRYTLIFVLFCGFIIAFNLTFSLENEMDKISEVINNSCYDDCEVNVKKDEGHKNKYIVKVQFKDVYEDSEWKSAADILSIINDINLEEEEIDSKISKYKFKFYNSYDVLLYTAEYINSNGEGVVKQIILNYPDGTNKVFTSDEINQKKEQEDNEMQKQVESHTNDSSNNNSSSNVKPPFDENNINKTIKCKDKTVTIKHMKRATHNENYYIEEGKEYIGIYVIYENKTNEDMFYGETEFNLVNGTGEVLGNPYFVLSNLFDHERLNNGTIIAKAKTEGYVMFKNNIINDKKMSLRFVCENNFIMEDVIKTVNLY